MRPPRLTPIALLLLAGLLVSLPGIAEAVEAGAGVGDCSEPCPGDSPEGNCSSSCDDCTCCPRAMSALLTPLPAPETPRRLEPGASAFPVRHPLVLVRGVFHPPRG